LKRKRHSEVNILGRRTILKRILKNNVDYAAVAQQRRQQCALLNRQYSFGYYRRRRRY
jgi:hypothetical protein